MAGTFTTYAEMLEAMKGLHLAKSVMDLLGPAGKHVKTWGQLDSFMHSQQLNKRTFLTPQCIADLLLQKLRDFYLANEARKGSNDLGLTEPYRFNPTSNSPRASTMPTRSSRRGIRRAAGRKGRGRRPIPGYGHSRPSPSLKQESPSNNGSPADMKPKIEPSSGSTTAAKEVLIALPAATAVVEGLLCLPKAIEPEKQPASSSKTAPVKAPAAHTTTVRDGEGLKWFSDEDAKLKDV